jgi:DNA-binding transcriptional LysR family regulator
MRADAMDKLTAIEYFLTAAKAGSFTNAARSLHIGLSSIHKQIVALEKELKVNLFERSHTGITLTPAGRRYFDACEPALAVLANAASVLATEDARPSGTLRVGGHGHYLRCLAAWLPGFHEHYPDIQLDLRIMTRPADLDDPSLDVMLVQGWPDKPDLIQKVIAQPRLLTCASPAYWAKHGLPACPSDIANYNCLFFTNVDDTVNDLWSYERDGETIAVQTKGWLNSDTRGATIDAALSSHGVIRVSDLVVSDHLHSGRLVPVLLDWHMLDAAPASVLYSPTRKRLTRVRVFVDFVVEAFHEMQVHTGYSSQAAQISPLPHWHRSRYRRASAAVMITTHATL